MFKHPVTVGKTDYPLKSSLARGSLPLSMPLRAGSAPFRLFDGPPYANGAPHLGHALNKHLKDTVARAYRQVFLVLSDEVRERAHNMVERMQFTPEAGRARLLAAMKNRPDWCVSRQRTWGVPLGLFVDKTTQQPRATATAMLQKAVLEPSLQAAPVGDPTLRKI